jgi:23S rRNA pseudouridine1911/1915/1917 synthase
MRRGFEISIPHFREGKEAMKKAKAEPKNAAPRLASAGNAGLSRSWEGVVGAGGAARADSYLAEMGLLSRSQLKARGAALRINGVESKLSHSLKAGDRLELRWSEESSSDLVPEDLPLSILFEDERSIVVDKAQGMVTHPGHGNHRGTLANALLWRLGRAADAAPGFRAGVVHRLDKDTSGVMIAAKDAEAQAALAAQFKDRVARKEYLAITVGLPSPPLGRIADRLGRDRRDRKRFASVDSGGKVAVTDYRVIAFWGGQGRAGPSYALVSLRPKTGRTHQLRVHMAKLGTPILGDPIYGKKDKLLPAATLMLHAYRLKITLPGREQASVFRAAIPIRIKDCFLALAAALGKGKAGPRAEKGRKNSKPIAD